MIIINFKTYKETAGNKGVIVAKQIEKVAKEHNTKVIVCPQLLDLRLLKDQTQVELFSQKVDDVSLGKFTGSIPAETVKEIGATGTLINHSEHQIPLDKIGNIVAKAKANNLTTVVCAATVEKGEQILKFKPDYIAIEPPELIGSDVSVSTGKPELIKDSVARLKKDGIKLLIGAGVRTSEDVRIALDYGADGVILASEVAKSKDVEKTTLDLILPFEQ